MERMIKKLRRSLWINRIAFVLAGYIFSLGLINVLDGIMIFDGLIVMVNSIWCWVINAKAFDRKMKSLYKLKEHLPIHNLLLPEN